MEKLWVTMFNAIAWTIWEARNHALFRGRKPDLGYFSDLVKFRVAWWFKHHGKGSSEPITIILENLHICCKDNKAVRCPTRKVWNPPANDTLMFNVDGSVRGEIGKAGIGGILRNSEGVELCSFYAAVGSMDVNAVELMAIHKACSLCLSQSALKERRILIVSDSKTAVSWVNEEDFGNLALLELIFDIRVMLRSLGKSTVSFNGRASNTAADILAKRGANGSGEKIEWSI